MDKTQGENGAERSAEEIRWDEEFADSVQDPKESDLAATVADLLKLAVSIPVALIQMPMNMLPEETARHTRAAAREGFLAVRSLLGAIGDGIEGMLTEPNGNAASTVSGPQGTWGSARQHSIYTPGSSSRGNARRIEVSDGSDSGEEDEESSGEEGRGLRADINY